MSIEITYASMLTQFGSNRGFINFEGMPCDSDCGALTALLWNGENLDVLRLVPLDVLRKMVDGAERYTAGLQARTYFASTVADATGYSERDVFDEALRDALALVDGAKQLLQHLATGAGEHPADAWNRERDERLATEAAEAALWSGFENLREFDSAAARMDDRDDLWCALNALVEAGVPMHLLCYGSVQPIYCHITEPNSSLSTGADAELAAVLDFLGLPYRTESDELILESDGDGWDFKTGRDERGWSTEIPGLDGWRQVPTSTVDEVHLALLACSDAYWAVMPARLKTSEFVHASLPMLFNVSSVHEIPRPAIREKALAVLAGQACPTSSLPACLR